jgi:hypothetical protein
MEHDPPPAEPPVRSVVPFFAITFGITWGMLVVYALVPEGVRAWIGPIHGRHPLFILAVYAPAIAALILVLRHTGLRGLRGFLSRLLLWRMPAVWWVVLLVLLPACYLSGTVQSAWSFTPFFIGSVGAGMILTGLFNAARGSLLLAALFHFQLNNPLWPDAQPWDMYLFAGVAVVVVWLDRRRMLARPGAVDGGVTGVTRPGV